MSVQMIELEEVKIDLSDASLEEMVAVVAGVYTSIHSPKGASLTPSLRNCGW